MVKKNYNAELKKYCQEIGIDLFGVADVSAIKKDFLISKDVLGKFDRAISLGVRLSGGVLEEIKDAPTRLYFHHYRTANVYLDQAALKLCHYIERKDFLAIPIPASQIVDWQKQTGHLSHKHIGVLAGLGWIGRNNLLVNKKLGCHFRLVTILTDMPLKADQPTKESCAGCRECVEVCPAKAIKENPADFAHLVCFEKLKDFQKQRLTDQYICGVCVNACRGGK
ncbi:MAG: 4Fe-4S binding protein [Candidatus Omnitrophica bacterium]|nr:4Fe-4S binding protein [Candidatus Omnitrophota bacterium]